MGMHNKTSPGNLAGTDWHRDKCAYVNGSTHTH